MDSAQKVHDDGGIGASHAKIDNCDTFCAGRDHIGVAPQNGYIEFLCKYFYVFVEVGQQNILSKIFQVTFCITG